MKFHLYKTYGALNSPPIFSALEDGLKKLGHTVSQDSDAIPVIWSVLWKGRMAPNRMIYESARKKEIPVMIVEVGNLLRNQSWRISLNNINREGIFGNEESLDLDRYKKFNIDLKPINKNRRKEILITLQHTAGLQWEGLPSVQEWLDQKIKEIRKHTDRTIVVRPHPRNPFIGQSRHYIIQNPRKLNNTYDDFDLDHNYHCVINHNSGTTVKSSINGAPVICDSTGLAYPVSESIENIENFQCPDRLEWFHKICHTEWFVDEIAQGIPLQRLERFLSQKG
jgi:hypothetical protein